MPLATLSVDLVAKLAKLEEGFDKANRIAAKNAAQIEAQFASIDKAARAVGATVVGAFAGVSLVALGRATIDGIDKLNDLSDATKLTVEQLSGLEDLGVRTGTSLDTISGAVLKLQQGLSSAKEGDEFSRTIEGLGLSIDSLKGKDGAAALKDVAVAFKGVNADSAASRGTLEIFGKTLREVAPFLKDFAEAGELSATVTTKQAEEAEKLNRQLFAMQKNSADTAREIANVLIPILNVLGESMGNAGKQSGELGTLAKIAQTVGETLAVLSANIKFVFQGVGREIAAIAAQIAALARGDLKGFRAISDAVKQDGVRARAELDALEKRIFGLRLPDLGQSDPRELARRGRGQATLPSLVIPVKPEKPGRAPKAVKGDFIGPEIPEALASALKGLEKVDSAKLAALNAELEQLFFIRKWQGGGAVDERIAELTEELMKFSPAAVQAAADKEKLNALLADTPTEELKRAREEMQFLAEQLDKGNISAEQFNEAATARLKLTGEETKKAKSFAEEMGLSFSSAFEDAIVKGESFRDVLRAIEQDILRIVTRQLVTEPLGKAISGLLSGGGGGGGLGDLLGGFFGFKANGGFVPPGGWAVAGERGPERVFGGRTGVTVQPSGRAMSLTIIQNLPAGVDRRSGIQAAAEAAVALTRAQRNL